MFDEIRKLKNQTVLITGATGLIGQAVVRRLLQNDVKVIAVVRNREKGVCLFGDVSSVTYVISDVVELEVKKYDVDYIIHAASVTSSKEFIDNPVGVILTAIEGTKRTLEIAKVSDVKGYVYLSSMEVYGTPVTDEKIDELHCTNLDTMQPRTAYPESKRLCECLCSSYFSQYGVPVKVIRLTQTFGPGVQYHDGRVFAEFARCAIEGRDILLHTKGETKRCYLYTEDAVDAILTVLVNGNVGEAYNAANDDTYCSIYEMAELVAREYGEGKICVRFAETDSSYLGYASTLHMNLDVAKLKALGWKPNIGISEMFYKLCEDMKEKYRIND